MAIAFMTALLEERNLAIALGRESATPSSAKATEAMLGRLSDTYAPVAQAPTGLSAQELHANVLVLLQGGLGAGGAPIAGGLGALINGAFPAPPRALDAPYEAAPDNPAPAKEKARVSFKRAPP